MSQVRTRKRGKTFSYIFEIGKTRDVTFAELYERWCKYKFKDEPVKSVYVAAYKNLSAIHGMKFSEIRKRHIQGVIYLCCRGGFQKLFCARDKNFFYLYIKNFFQKFLAKVGIFFHNLAEWNFCVV